MLFANYVTPAISFVFGLPCDPSEGLFNHFTLIRDSVTMWLLTNTLSLLCAFISPFIRLRSATHPSVVIYDVVLRG